VEEKKPKKVMPKLEVPELTPVSELSPMYNSPAVLGKPCPPVTLQEAAIIARSVAVSGAFKAVVKSEHEALLKIQLGRELGVGPVASLGAFYLLDRDAGKGKVSMSAQLMAALVNKSEDYKYTVAKADDRECIIIWTHYDSIEWVHLGDSSFSIQDAKRANLYKPAGAWQKYPEEMCFARALAKGFRRFTPHLAYGMSTYLPEEFGHDTINDVEEVEFSVNKLSDINNLMEENK